MLSLSQKVYKYMCVCVCVFSICHLYLQACVYVLTCSKYAYTQEVQIVYMSVCLFAEEDGTKSISWLSASLTPSRAFRQLGVHRFFL